MNLLREVEPVSDHLIIIDAGRIVADGSPDQLRPSRSTLVRAIDASALAGALRAAGQQARMSADGALETDAKPKHVGRIAARAGGRSDRTPASGRRPGGPVLHLDRSGSRGGRMTTLYAAAPAPMTAPRRPGWSE